MCIGEVGSSFVGETHCIKLGMPDLHKWVDEIELRLDGIVKSKKVDFQLKARFQPLGIEHGEM